ncbi:MAG: hypothetical protein NT154_06870 [Verrucomicrobia bacterium]|nr:hypothetical protein [Verrucomicrobiota bacterium]
MRTYITTLVIATTLATTSIAAPRKIFEVTFDDVPGGGLVCNVAFFGKPPPPATVDKILRSALESAILVDSSRDILAMAFLGDTAMSQTQHSGDLVYKAAQKRIMTFDESQGIKSSGADAGAYYVETREEKTFEGITPEKRWLVLTVVFPKTPTSQQAYEAAVTEAVKAAQKGMDVTVYVKVGDKATKTSWRQIRDPSGGFVFVEYEANTKTIRRETKVFKTLQ